MIFAKAPLRISFGGGGTDVHPYVDEYGGHVLSATIDYFAKITMEHSCHPSVSDLIGNLSDNHFELINFLLKKYGLKDKVRLNVALEKNACGLGSSSALVVAIVGACEKYIKTPFSDNLYYIAEKSHHLERIEFGDTGGIQDQYASTFGGFNFIEFLPDGKIVVNPLRLSCEDVEFLSSRLLLVDFGKRTNFDIMDEQKKSFIYRNPLYLQALSDMKDIALDMKRMLVRGEWDDFGRALDEVWQLKKQYSSLSTNPNIDSVYKIAKRHGALGGKICGMGSGGAFLFYVPFEKYYDVKKILSKWDCFEIPFSFSKKGLMVWEDEKNV